jgi:hypothetical protein
VGPAAAQLTAAAIAAAARPNRAAGQPAQVDDEAGGEQLRTGLPQQLHRAFGGAAGRDQVVHQHHTVAL